MTDIISIKEETELKNMIDYFSGRRINAMVILTDENRQHCTAGTNQNEPGKLSMLMAELYNILNTGEAEAQSVAEFSERISSMCSQYLLKKAAVNGVVPPYLRQ